MAHYLVRGKPVAERVEELKQQGDLILTYPQQIGSVPLKYPSHNPFDLFT
jgi:hypothetical protein